MFLSWTSALALCCVFLCLLFFSVCVCCYMYIHPFVPLASATGRRRRRHHTRQCWAPRETRSVLAFTLIHPHHQISFTLEILCTLPSWHTRVCQVNSGRSPVMHLLNLSRGLGSRCSTPVSSASAAAVRPSFSALLLAPSTTTGDKPRGRRASSVCSRASSSATLFIV